MRGPLVENHRFDQAPLLSEPIVVVLEKIGDRVLREEISRDTAHGGLLGHGLRAVLAELGDVTLVFLGPRAAGAVEPVLLIHAQQRPGTAHEAHLLDRHLKGVHHGGNADSFGRGRRDTELRLVDICGGGGLCHGGFSGWTLRRERLILSTPPVDVDLFSRD